MRQLTALLAAAAIAVTVGACTSGKGKRRATSPTTPSHAPVPQGSVDAAQFVSRVVAAVERAETVSVTEETDDAEPGSAPVKATGSLRFTAKTADATVSARTQQGPVQEIDLGSDVYIDGLEKGMIGAPWIKNGRTLRSLSWAIYMADPRNTLPMLATVGALEPAGTKTINGVATTHYSLAVNLEAAARLSPDLASAVNGLITEGVTVQDVHVWIDSRQRPVRLFTSLEVLDSGPNPQVRTRTQTINYTDWGAPVTIAAPPADQVSEK